MINIKRTKNANASLDTMKNAYQDKLSGMTWQAIAKKYGVASSTLSYWFKKAERLATEETAYYIPKVTKDMAINDGGEREFSPTGAAREPAKGKGRYDLISPYGLDRLAKWYELGSYKYSDRNWEKGLPTSRCIDSACRHLNGYMMGKVDEDHLAAAVWNIMAIMHFEEVMPEMQNIPSRRTK